MTEASVPRLSDITCKTMEAYIAALTNAQKLKVELTTTMIEDGFIVKGKISHTGHCTDQLDFLFIYAAERSITELSSNWPTLRSTEAKESVVLSNPHSNPHGLDLTWERYDFRELIRDRCRSEFTRLIEEAMTSKGA